MAYPFLREFQRRRHAYNVGKWVLDSGAFSAFNAGVRIDLREYIAACRDVDACEVFGLDVIGDYEAGRRNLEAMWAAGVPAIPTYHPGEPWEVLEWAARNAEKIALGSGADSLRLAGKRGGASQVLLQAFARVWPKRIHGFGMASRAKIALAPFHSVDASSWTFAPQAMGRWCGFTGRQMPVSSKGDANKDLWIEVEEHQRRERWARFHWRRELALVDSTYAA